MINLCCCLRLKSKQIIKQNNVERYVSNTGSLSDANRTNISVALSAKEVFLARFSLYFLSNLLQASDPSSEKDFKPHPLLTSLNISSE